jgi:hypothetical protein
LAENMEGWGMSVANSGASGSGGVPAGVVLLLVDNARDALSAASDVENLPDAARALISEANGALAQLIKVTKDTERKAEEAAEHAQRT